MSSYGELIQALRVLKNVKEKRHGIKTLARLCSNRAFQVRIVQRGGWRTAILPLIISLDEDCRMYAALAVANLSTSSASHAQLLEEEVLRHLVPILQSEEAQEVIAYVLNALGNFACSNIMWHQLQQMNTAEGVVTILKQTQREEIRINSLFCLANLTADPWHRKWMMAKEVYELVWGYMQDPNYSIMSYSLAILRGLAVEPEAQELFPQMGLVPLLIGIFHSQCPQTLKTLTMDLLLHFSMLKKNAGLMMEKEVMHVIELAGRGSGHVEYVPSGIAIIANICESVELHDRVVESPLFEVLTEHIHNDNTNVQSHMIRALMQLSLSPKYHHVILSTGAMANVCPVAMTERLSIEMRTNALQLMAAVCATHPTTPTASDTIDLMFLICNDQENIDIRRAAALVIANASSDAGNLTNLLHKPYMEALSIAISKSDDCVLVDYLMQFFHNLVKLEQKAGGMLMTCGFQRHLFNYERLESLSIVSAIYLCDTCRQLAGDAVVRATLLEEMLFSVLADAWVVYVEDQRLAPHLALMCSAFCYHTDSHSEFVLQGGVRLVIQLYSQSKVEHVRLCSLLSLLYLAESGQSQRCIAQEKGIHMLLTACENETHIDLIVNALKALIPFATSDDFRPQLGMEGALDTFSSFLFSDQLQLQQLGVYLLQNLLEFRENRRIFLNLAEEKKCEEDYLETLLRFLPKVSTGAPKRIKAMKKKAAAQKDTGEALLTPHDPFIVRSVIHSAALLSLEHNLVSFQRFISLGLPKLLFDLFYSEQIDKSSGEAIVLFFANLLHSTPQIQAQIMKGADICQLLLSPRDMLFAPHTIARCLSALLCIARVADFKRAVISQLDLLMADLNANLNAEKRDENFYQTAALHCALLSELARASYEHHERMARAGMVEALLVFITVAGKGLNNEVCIELLMSSVFGIAALVGSPTSGEQCMASLIFPATRMQLLLSLLRLPSEDINQAFYQGTVGLRTLQRAVYPDISPEELHVDYMDMVHFLGNCHVRPSDFIYRNVIRTMCLLLAHPEMGPRVQQAMAPSNVVPTCLFAMKTCDDTYVQVYGFLLIANFSKDRTLLNAFLSESAVINELLTTVRRSGPTGNPQDKPMRVQDELAAQSRGGSGPWSSNAVQLNRYMLAMAALTNFAEHVKEKFKGDDGEIPVDPEMADDGGLIISNRITLNKLTSTAMKVLDCEDMEAKGSFTDVQEFTALLRVLIMNNTFLAKVELQDPGRGGEVKLEPLDAALASITKDNKKQPKDALVLPPLRHEFRSLGQLNSKCAGMLQVVRLCLSINAAPSLVAAIIESLTGLTFLSPLSVKSPVMAYQLSGSCPEWLQPGLMGLIANCLADPARIGQFHEEDEENSMAKLPSDHLFPLLATSRLEVRQKVLGMLANAAAQEELLDFIRDSGVFRICKAIPGKGWFTEHFALMIEITRMLCNMCCRTSTHNLVMTPDTMAFLRDVMRHCALLLHTVDLNSGADGRDEEAFDYYEITFEPTDAPPLGLRIRWELPPQLSEVLPDTPAARVAEELRIGDELVEVNGTDVTELEQADITPMFEARPLRLLFRRKPNEMEQDLYDEANMQNVGNVRIEQVKKVVAYGDAAQYLECFNLAVLVVHNLAVQAKNLKLLHSEPKILQVLLEVMPADSTSPALRRLIFSTLTCLCQERAVSGRIFYAMADYFQSCQKTDSSLQKYIMCCANLFYTSMSREEVQPDRGMLMFVSRISAAEDAVSSRRALIEILHGMSQAPKELRRKFLSREILVLAVKYMEMADFFDVQVRAFESIYFCTLGACAPELWADLQILPRMVKAAGFYKNLAEEEGSNELMHRQADSLWEMALRTLDYCLRYDILVQDLKIPDLDRYLMELLIDGRKGPELSKCAADLMAGLLQSSICGIVWSRWRGLGIGERIVSWFKVHQNMLLGEDNPYSEQQVQPSESLDAMLHMLIFAVQVDSSMVVALVADDVLKTIAHRILCLAKKYEEWNEISGGRRLSDDLEQERRWATEGADDLPELPPGVHRPSADEVAKADASFRIIAQLMTALVANEFGLAAMSTLNLEPALIALLEIPSSAFRMPVMLVLCAMSTNKTTCELLMKSPKFLGVLRRMEKKLTTPGEAPPTKDEVEYLMCILDRSCCHPDLAMVAQEELFRLICVLPSKAETLSARLMSLRALSRCAFVNPECMNQFAIEGLACLQYVMCINSALNMGSAEDNTQKVAQRRRLIQEIQETLASNPDLAPLVQHFSRAILCEAVSVSRASCNSTFGQLDLLGMLQDLKYSFDDAVQTLEYQSTQTDVMAAELMNKLVAMLHVTLCSVFRHGKAPHQYNDMDAEQMKEKANGGFTDSEAKATADSLVRLLDQVHEVLYLGFESVDRSDPMAMLADMMTSDIRVLYYLTALLREVASKPLRSPFLSVTRSKAFFEVLDASIRLALKRFQRETKGPPPKDLFSNKLKGGPGETPLAKHMDEFDLSLIFEHLIVCMRHTMVQAMFVTPEVSTEPLPWAWVSQERLKMHTEAMEWLPLIVMRYKNTPAIRVETLRYFTCAACYEAAPKARPQDLKFEEGAVDVETGPPPSADPPLPPPAETPPAVTHASEAQLATSAGTSAPALPTSEAAPASAAAETALAIPAAEVVPASPTAEAAPGSPTAEISSASPTAEVAPASPSAQGVAALPPTATVPARPKPVAVVTAVERLPQVSVSLRPQGRSTPPAVAAVVVAAPTPKAATVTSTSGFGVVADAAEAEDEDEFLEISPAPVQAASPAAHSPAARSSAPVSLPAAKTSPATPAAHAAPAAPAAPAAHASLLSGAADHPQARGSRQAFGGLISLRQPELRNFLVEELENSEDIYTLCLAMLAVANFAGYEREQLANAKKKVRLEQVLPLEDISRLLRGMVRVMNVIPKFPPDKWDISNAMTLHGLRFICNLLALDVDSVTAELHRLDVLTTIKSLFEFWFWDENRIADGKLYVHTLQNFVLVLRNWSCGSCLAELDAKQKKAKAKDRETKDEMNTLLKILTKGIDVCSLIMFSIKVTKAMTECTRELPNYRDELDKVLTDILIIFTTLLKRTDDQKNMNWIQQGFDLFEFEQFLQFVKSTRFTRQQVFEDEKVMNTLYLMVKQAFPFKGQHFLEYLMEVAYGDHRDEHTTLQDMAAVCCAIISTQNAKDASAPTVNVANVVKDNAAFIHSLVKVPDPKMQIWHYRLITGWSRRPKVLDDITGDEVAMKHVVDWLLNTNLCRYSVVIVHNISMLRSHKLMPVPGYLSTICEAYRQLLPGTTLHRGDENQRRLVRRLLLASIRNCLWNSEDVQADLADPDMQAIIDLVDCIEEKDVPFYMALLMHVSEGCDLDRVRRAIPSHQKFMELVVRCMFEQTKACVVDSEAESVFEMGFYALITEEEQKKSEIYEKKVEEQDTIASAPKKKTDKYAKLLATPGSTAIRGLGKAPSLYQRSRRRGQHPAAAASNNVTMSASGPVGGFSSIEERRGQQEFLYMAAVELLTYTTFTSADEKPAPPPDSDPHRSDVKQAIDSAFSIYRIEEYLRSLWQQIEGHLAVRVVLSDMFIHVSAKFVWHCWSQSIFQDHMNTPVNLELLAKIVPFFLGWPNQDVQTMASDVAVYAGLHRYPSVCEFLADHHKVYPELTCALLTRCVISPQEETGLKAKQAINFLKIFVRLLKERALSHTGLLRLAIGIETGLLMDSPKGICGILAQREFELLGDLLEALATYSESGTVKQAMVVALTRTVGKYYKALPELDEFVLRILDMSVPLLDAEFTLFMPVLYRLASEGGRRVQGPMLSRQLHLRVARLLEHAVGGVEADQHKIAGYNDEDESAPEPIMGPRLGNRERMQWCLAFLTALATVQVHSSEATTRQAQLEKAQDIHFDSFVCVDLLPMLVRILRQSPLPFEALAVCFLLSSVSTSPCLPPHMPDVLRISEKAFPTLLGEVTSPSSKRREVEDEPERAVQGPSWGHLKVPPLPRIEAGITRSFIHLLSRAAHEPIGNASVLTSMPAWRYLTGLKVDPDIFADAGACIHAKLFALANLLKRVEDHKTMLDMGVLDTLIAAKVEIEEQLAIRAEEPDFPDLRLPWTHCVISLIALSGSKLLVSRNHEKFSELIAGALEFANDLQYDSRMKIQSGMGGLALDFECMQALGAALAPLAAKSSAFGMLRPKYTLYLLCLVCSAPLLSLRQHASRYLTDILNQGHEPEFAGAAFLKTSCLESFRCILAGPLDDLAANCAHLMIALANSCYDVHVHLLELMGAVVLSVANPHSGPNRVIALAELFVALTTPRTVEVLEGFIQIESVMPFLGLARSAISARRLLVQKWLENFGSSLYELDEVSEVFQQSTLQGILYVCARSTLDPEQAMDLRRVMFGLVLKRVETWRASYFGPYEFLSETIISALVPMCELQPDLVGALVALFHSFITRGETRLLQRLWTGNHMPWLCKRMAAKSRHQLKALQHQFETTGAGAAAKRAGVPLAPDHPGVITDIEMKKGWERHIDLVAMQGMVMRIAWHIYDLFPAEFGAQVIKQECIVKNWRDHLTFFCHQAQWPLPENKELQNATTAVLSLEMRLLHRLVHDVNEDLQKTLVQQGVIGVCSTILLPTPEQQDAMQAAIGEEEVEGREEDFSETFVLTDAKMLAGAVISRLLFLPDAYKYVQERRASKNSVAMYSQLHHWRNAVFDQQGSVAVLPTVTLLERCATLYVAMISCQTVDWCFENMGLAHMDIFTPIMLKLWSLHPNPTLKHHALRIFSGFCQIHTLYSSVLQSHAWAEQVGNAIHRTFGIWDVRELRHVMRLMIASLSHALNIPTMSELFGTLVARSLARKADCKKLVEVLRNGAAPRATQNAAKHVLRANYLTQVLTWCEKPGDNYGRAWALWIVDTMLVHEVSAAQIKLAEANGPLEPDQILMIEEKTLEEEQMQRRNKLKDEVDAAAGKSPDSIKEERSKQALSKTRTHWIRENNQLVRNLALTAGKCISFQWKESQQIGCVSAALCLMELKQFVLTAVQSIDGNALCKCFTLPEKSLQIASIMLVSVIASIRLPLNAQNIAAEFLKRFHDLQQTLIEKLASHGEGPYDMIARWLHEPPLGLPCENEFRCLVSFMVGQCICPPLAATPSLDLESAIAAPGRGIVPYQKPSAVATLPSTTDLDKVMDEEEETPLEIPDGAPPVAECGVPPEALLEKIAEEVIKEDLRLRSLQTPKGEGPIFSTMLCHLLYALAVMVPHHPKAAAQSVTVRGAAFTQLMKVQQIVAQGIEPKVLFDTTDGDQQKLFLYVRATACIRSALQSIMASWFAADFGARFVISEEGGKDFMQYCTKHINQVYTSKTAVTRVLGSPWERVMLSQGPTTTIAELLIVVCSSDANLVELSKLGGEQALHSLSRHGDNAQIRQQATMLLTKLAVMLKIT
eukprot:TRINITY_DN7010_c0_g1_i1.p1 TRINITY_DN7010_c0_g1~~TRINITY_DN7010_c0_g1_i1.p1  ORF type:complete len:5389 (-),score=1202.56 TRINITY_DN7010_c0_g1_i1:94-16260(-)